MTDPTAIPITVPPLALTLVHDFAQKGLTVLATTAAGYGLIATSQEAEVVSGGVAIALFVASCAWTYVAARLRAATLRAAIDQPAPVPAAANTAGA